MVIQIRVSTPDLNATVRAFRNFEQDAKDLADQAGTDVAQELAGLIRSFAGTQGRQAARAAETVEAVGGHPPKVQAGAAGSQHARDLLPGSEFGATRHFGWYRKPRYYNSRGKQFPPHLGSGSYWFFRAYEANRERAIAQYGDALDDIVREWGSGG